MTTQLIHEKATEVIVDPEFQSLIPPITDEEHALLRESIGTEGCREPLVTWNGILLDGHNRLRICRESNIPYRTAEIEVELEDRDAAKVWIIQNQFGRRNLNNRSFPWDSHCSL
ncbi:hypothetical protein ACFL2Q_12875 [Thermodesulfobacteriota bacterium]